ncbi:TfdD [Sphingomonas histidinilytica]|uniref:muconate/chloromuconate family cycloisomerase n=1 Tax=Rhizorhabdus histidinilytica TaxID=439228 RepID=UPI001ADAF221|nr:muconate/chloromuconate family cycloisomerase [Rhizorhabdus histidinilytica]MBO9378821.1 TfdD [Rhizorhabdus histidinilytica]
MTSPKPETNAVTRHLAQAVASCSREDAIDRVEAVIVDVPLRRQHFHASGTHAGQSLVIITVGTRSGAVGVGEGSTPAGTAFWGGECVETIKVIIDQYLAPAIIGLNVFAHETLLAAMDRAAAANHFAKAGVDCAIHDLVGRVLNVPIGLLYGGRVRDSLPVLWALATSELDADVEDARRMLDERRHRFFKIKIGKGDPRVEARRAIKTLEAIRAMSEDTLFSVDLNQAWDEPTSARLLPSLQDAGFDIIEQPVEAWNVAAMARLADRLDIPILSDESLWDYHDVFDAATRRSTDVYAVKVAKGGGIRRAYKAANVAEAAGIPLYGGMALESSLGTAAGLQLFSALSDLPWGCELIGPRLLGDDLTTEPTVYRDFEVMIPHGPGLGVTVDPDKVARWTRK